MTEKPRWTLNEVARRVRAFERMLSVHVATTDNAVDFFRRNLSIVQASVDAYQASKAEMQRLTDIIARFDSRVHTLEVLANEKRATAWTDSMRLQITDLERAIAAITPDEEDI